MRASLKQIAQADDLATVRRAVLRMVSAIERRHLTTGAGKPTGASQPDELEPPGN